MPYLPGVPWIEPTPQPEPLTVAQAIAILQTMPQDAIIETEGCDCIDKCRNISHDAKDNTVLMER